MKKKNLLLLKKMASVFLVCLFYVTAKGQVTCYDESESTATDFWFSHFYYAKCTDYLGTGSKLFGDNNDYIDFNGGSSVEFTKIRVATEGEYIARLSYGIGYADDEGAVFKLFVNDEFISSFTVYRLTSDPPATIDLPVYLYPDWDNSIKIQQQKDWPIVLGIQLINPASEVINHSLNNVRIIVNNHSLLISGLQEEKSNKIAIFSSEGRLISSEVVLNNTYRKELKAGLYFIKINDSAIKVIIN